MDDNMVLINEDNLYDIADAIRRKNGDTVKYLPEEMAPAIDAIPTGEGATLEGNLALSYDSLTFPVLQGTSCIYDGGYYVASTDISAVEPFNLEHWTRTTTGTQIRVLNSDVDELLSFVGNSPNIVSSYYIDTATWDSIASVFELVQVRESLICLTTAEVSVLLSGNVVNGTLKAIVTRVANTTYDIFAMVAGGGSNGLFATWRVSNIRVSPTIGNVSRYISVNNVTGARDARTMLQTLCATYTTFTGTTVSFNLVNNARSLIILSSASINYNAIFFAVADNSGVVKVVPINQSQFTLDYSTPNILTITSTTAFSCRVVIINLLPGDDTIPTMV